MIVKSRREKINEYLEEKPRSTSREIATAIDETAHIVSIYLSKMTKRKDVIGEQIVTPKKCWVYRLK